MNRFFKIYGVVLAVMIFTGCGIMPVKTESKTKTPQTNQDVKNAYSVDEHDPFETFNRRMYEFNSKFDKYVFLPVIKVYEFITPDFLETGISNFFSNIGEIKNFTNSLLQFKGESFLKTTGRIVINSTIGLFGFVDVAEIMDIPRQNEDFGQTLGFYGVGQGPYLVLPILGPCTLRDTLGKLTDSVFFYTTADINLDKTNDLLLPYILTDQLDTRHKQSFRYYKTGSPFEYELIRMLYFKKRTNQVNQ